MPTDRYFQAVTLTPSEIRRIEKIAKNQPEINPDLADPLEAIAEDVAKRAKTLIAPAYESVQLLYMERRGKK